MQELLSPSYKHEKLINPTFDDYIDVFEDCWRNYILSPCEALLHFPHGDVAAMTVLSSYFEAIWIYISGADSAYKSREFFVNGFSEVFQANVPGITKAAEAVYAHIRCGLAHGGMLRHKVSYSRGGSEPFFLTYPKKPTGELDLEAPVVSIIVNSQRVYEGVRRHFEGYIRRLRSFADEPLCDAFRRTCERLWAVGANSNIAAITESEFLGN